jgi:methylmalonyl-CoA mutase N-terminal domain/subunit
LTDEIEKRAWEYVEKIDNLGGIIKAIELGLVKRDLFNTASRMQEEIEKREKVVVGVNQFATEDEEDPFHELYEPIDQEEVKRTVLERYYKVKEERNPEAVARTLKKLKEAAGKKENLVLPCLDVVKAYATINETVAALKEVFGAFDAHSTLH